MTLLERDHLCQRKRKTSTIVYFKTGAMHLYDVSLSPSVPQNSPAIQYGIFVFYARDYAHNDFVHQAVPREPLALWKKM